MFAEYYELGYMS